MKHLSNVFIACLLVTCARAQSIDVNFSVDASHDTARISPYIYGANADAVEQGVGITARRLGGNRMSGYNWENNASSAGSDWQQSSDDYMTYVFGIPYSREFIPGITLTAFHDTSLSHGDYSLLTLPAAGYVARDKNGTVDSVQTAPSYRWRQVVNFKGAPFFTSPDTADGNVYVDEEVNFLVNKYGPASGPTGVRGYDIDNEPALWPSTHPRIHPKLTTCRELITKVAGAAAAVKSVDPTAEVFGGVFYGFLAYYNFQNAPDWSSLSKNYENYAAAFLANMRDSSTAAGKRLLDVLDLHWYPDLTPAVTNDNTDSNTVYNRIEAPRTLWDSAFVESGWIGQWFHPQSAAILRKTQRIIRQQYPGTKLSVSEFYYGGAADISGAVAIADVLGVFGSEGVYFASYWGPVTGYTASAYRMYRNYDGHGGTFGDVSLSASTSDNPNSAIHASLDSRNEGAVHVIAINRSMHKTINGHFTFASTPQLLSAGVYAVQAGNTQILALPGIASIQGNQFSYELAPMSVYHFVIATQPASVAGAPAASAFALEQNYPNPFNPTTRISFSVGRVVAPSGVEGPASTNVRLVVYDILGRELAVLADGRYPAGKFTFTFDGSTLASGVYFYRLTAGSYTAVRKMALLK